MSVLKAFKDKYEVEVIMELGSAVAWETGVLRSTILDIVENGGVRTIIPDVSFTCHMPDTLEMPYRPKIQGTVDHRDSSNHLYRIGGVSCLAGDFLGEYAFENKPKIGDNIIFEDMMHYTTVKTTTFNGIQHPSIGVWRNEGFELLRPILFDFWLQEPLHK